MVTVLAMPGTVASDVPAAVLAPPPLPGNDPVTAFRRLGARVTQAWCARLQRSTGMNGRLGSGVLLLPQRERDHRRFARLPRGGPGPVRLTGEEASALSGTRLDAPCAYHPGGGWFAPAAFTDALLRHAGATPLKDVPVATLERDRDEWIARDDEARSIARAPVCVLAAGMACSILAPSIRHCLIPARGQASAVSPNALRMAVSGGGYAVPDAEGRLWLGATIERGESDTTVRAPDHEANLALYRRLWPASGTPSIIDAFVAVRATTRDRLPLAGHLGEGLWINTGHGTQGLASAPLTGTLLARAIAGRRGHPLLRRLHPGRIEPQARQASTPT